MRVLLVRHGEAVSPDVARDAERWLTERGRAITHAVAEALRPTVTVGHIFTSPLVRAVQTADLLASGLGFSGALLTLSDGGLALGFLPAPPGTVEGFGGLLGSGRGA